MGSLPESRSEAEAGWQAFDEVEKGSHKPIDAKARSQGHVELVVNYRTAGDLLNTMMSGGRICFPMSMTDFLEIGMPGLRT